MSSCQYVRSQPQTPRLKVAQLRGYLYMMFEPGSASAAAQTSSEVHTSG
jgi:hypothetical protein